MRPRLTRFALPAGCVLAAVAVLTPYLLWRAEALAATESTPPGLGDGTPGRAPEQAPPGLGLHPLNPPILPAASQEEPARPPPGPRIEHRRQPPGPKPALAQAYRSYLAHDLAGALSAYRAVLADDPANPDALNGIAATLLAGGLRDEAREWFRHGLALDPHNATARAGLLHLGDPVAPEARSLIEGGGPAQDAGLYTEQGRALLIAGRHHAAQEAFFEAYQRQPESPDAAYNLAVSLDHLGQPDIARRYYREALRLAQSTPTGFDPLAASERLARLAPAAQPAREPRP